MKTIIAILRRYNISDMMILRLYIMSSIALGITSFCLFIFLFSKIFPGKIINLLYIVLTLIPIALLNLLSKGDNRIARCSTGILQTLTNVIDFIINFGYPGIVVVMSYFCVLIIALSISCIPILFIRISNILILSTDSIIFISIATASISSVYCTKIIRWILKNHSPLKDWGEHEYQKYQIDLALYVINGRNIHLLVNILYFTYLLFSGFFMIQYDTPLISKSADYAILKAFLVFIAFSGIVNAYKGKDISSEKLASKMLNIILARYTTSISKEHDASTPNIKNSISDTDNSQNVQN